MKKEKPAEINSKRIILRPATPEDSNDAAELIFMTGPGIFKYLFYPEIDISCDVLQRFFILAANDFSYRYVTIAESESKICGLIHCVDRKVMKQNHRAMGFRMIKVLGLLPALIRMPRSIQFESIFPDIDSNTLYISHLATFEFCRGQGAAGRLLSFSQQLAKQKGLGKLALDVELDNDLAMPVYEHYGFSISARIESPKFKARFGFPGVYRMERPVSP